MSSGGRGDRVFLHVLLVEGLAVKVLGEIHYWVCWIKDIVWVRCAGFRVLLLGHVEVVVCVVNGVLGEGRVLYGESSDSGRYGNSK